jgi:threonine dehydrogenase-like Zn-dependent dehydrogenase
LGAWRQVANVDAANVVPVPDSVPDEVAAQMLCNPVTAVMLRRTAQQHFAVGYDGVVLNNAAASSVGRLFTAVAEHHQIATISIVRREERAQQLRDRFLTVPAVSPPTRLGERCGSCRQPTNTGALDRRGATAAGCYRALLGGLITTANWPKGRCTPPRSCTRHLPYAG